MKVLFFIIIAAVPAQTQTRPCFPPPLTLSMPRDETPDSDSENSEPAFRFEKPPITAQAPSTSGAPRPSPRSLFSRARQAIEEKRRQGVASEALSDEDPFSFRVEGEDRGPPKKRPRRQKRAENERGGQSKGTECKEPQVFPSSSKEQTEAMEEEIVSKRKMASEDDTGEQAKKSRKDETELPPRSSPTSSSSSVETVRYRQLTRTRTIKTVTVAVQHIVTVRTVDKASGEVVDVITYEENEQPKIEYEEKETEEEGEIVESVGGESQSAGLLLSAAKVSPPKKERRRSQSPRAKRDKAGESSRDKRGGRRDRDAGGVEGEYVQRERREDICEPPPLTRQATLPVCEERERERLPLGDLLEPGTRILAKWLDNYFYPAQITAGPNKNGQYSVSFDDGDRRRISRDNLIVRNLLRVGQNVLVQGIDDCYEEGRVVGHYRTDGERGYKIEKNDGKIGRSPVSKVILSAEQAAGILSSSSSVTMTNTSSSGSIVLRSRRSTLSERGSSPSLFSGDTSSKDTSEESSERDACHKMASPSVKAPRTAKKGKATDGNETPKSSLKRKFTGRATRGRKRAETSSEASSDERGKASVGGKRKRARRGLSELLTAKSPSAAVREVPTLRRSPRKHPSVQETHEGQASTALCPMPRDRNLFAGFAFLITGVPKTMESEESDSESESIVFNRTNLVRQIEAGGGTLMTNFTQSQTTEAEGRFLISNTYQRTQKYFQSLASGISCVSHVWIHDSCTFNKKLNHKKYLLPAGRSLETGQVVECRPRRNILKGMTVSCFVCLSCLFDCLSVCLFVCFLKIMSEWESIASSFHLPRTVWQRNSSFRDQTWCPSTEPERHVNVNRSD